MLDLVLALTTLATSLGLELGFALGTATPATAVSYSWLLWPALAGRGGVQALACYDRRRYDQAIPWLALTMIASGFTAWRLPEVPAGLVAAYGLLGAVQLISWRRSR